MITSDLMMESSPSFAQLDPPAIYASQPNPIGSDGSMASAKFAHALGICEIVNSIYPDELPLTPVQFANGMTKRPSDRLRADAATVVVLKAPRHGAIVAASADGDLTHSKYLPVARFNGRDTFVLKVSDGARSVTLHFDILITTDRGVTLNDNPRCPALVWRIS